jgi:hypothetical protein
MNRKQFLDQEAEMRRQQIKEEILPKITKALKTGNYQFLARDKIRIWSLSTEPYEGMEEPGELEQLIIDSIDVSWE